MIVNEKDAVFSDVMQCSLVELYHSTKLHSTTFQETATFIHTYIINDDVRRAYLGTNIVSNPKQSTSTALLIKEISQN
jgi:hypothetical protein